MLLILLLTSCAPSLASFPFDPGAPPLQLDDPTLQVKFHGVATFEVHYNGLGILTDPFWSHLPLHQVAFGEVAPDPAQIEPWLGPLDSVQAVLVGHGHYDHVLDLPAIAHDLHPRATIYASNTVKHTFAPSSLPRPIVAINPMAATARHSGEWIELADGAARVLPLVSGHPEQWLWFHLFTDRLTQDRVDPPTRASHYQEGDTFGFLLDFLDGDRVAHRVYIQTSSTGLPAGAVPASVLEERRVDVALVAMDVANHEARGRSVLNELQPRSVVFCHWEDFFRSKDEPPAEIVKVDLHRLHEALPDTSERSYLFPSWGAVYRFDPSGRLMAPGDR